MRFPLDRLKIVGLAVGSALLLSACQPAHTQGRVNNGVFLPPVSAQDRVYRTSDGRIFRTRAERDAYLRRIGRERERRIYEEELRRDAQLRRQREAEIIAAERAATRRARREARLERERRREAEIIAAERNAERRARREARRERERRREAEIIAAEQQAERRARRQARREAERARRAQEQRELDARIAREEARLHNEAVQARRQREIARAQRNARLDLAEVEAEIPGLAKYEGFRRIGETNHSLARRVRNARRRANSEGGQLTNYLQQPNDGRR